MLIAECLSLVVDYNLQPGEFSVFTQGYICTIILVITWQRIFLMCVQSKMYLQFQVVINETITTCYPVEWMG